MKVLGIETSGARGGVALVEDGRRVAERLFDKGMVHGREIAPGIRDLCAEAGWPLEAVDLLACDIGPGSYTGLRVGLAAAKGLAFALRKPIAGVPSLDVLAEQGLDLARVLCPAIDAKWNQIYGAVYVEGRRTTEFLAEKPDVFAARVPADALVLGDALDAYADLFRGRPQAPRERWDPRPGTVALLGERLHAQGVRHDPASLVPLYLRPTEAELKFGPRAASQGGASSRGNPAGPEGAQKRGTGPGT